MADFMGELPEAGGPNMLDSLLSSAGLNEPYMRFLVGAAAASAALWYLKPSSMFLANGVARPFSLFSNDDPTNATVLPWYIVAVLVGAVLSLFI
jgi:hypothetical protein